MIRIPVGVAAASTEYSSAKCLFKIIHGDSNPTLVQIDAQMIQTWLDLAKDARRSANRLLTEENFRSCIFRSYYAAYSKVSHELVVTARLTMPLNREGPNHPGEFGTGGIRRLIETSMPNMHRARRLKLSELMGRLYTLRVDADYKPSVQVESRDAREAVSLMNKVFYSF